MTWPFGSIEVTSAVCEACAASEDICALTEASDEAAAAEFDAAAAAEKEDAAA